SSSPPSSVSSVAMTTLSAPCAASVATRSSSLQLGARGSATTAYSVAPSSVDTRRAWPSTSSDTGSALPCRSSITHSTLATAFPRELAAVEDDDRAGHVRGRVRGEVDDERPQLLRLADTAQRDVADDLGPDLDVVERLLVEVGAKPAGCDGIDGD